MRLPPDIAVEVVSERARDRQRDRVEKAKDYAAFGVRLYVLVDPEARSFEALHLVKGKWMLAVTATRGSVTLPGCDGLTLDLDDLWSEVESLDSDDM